MTFFIFISEWLVYYAYLRQQPSDASLGAILTYMAYIALAASVFAYFFSRARTTFVWSYYVATAAFLIISISLDAWAQTFADSANYRLLYAAFFSLMLLALLVIHVLQMALSRKGETAIVISE